MSSEANLINAIMTGNPHTAGGAIPLGEAAAYLHRLKTAHVQPKSLWELEAEARFLAKVAEMTSGMPEGGPAALAEQPSGSIDRDEQIEVPGGPLPDGVLGVPEISPEGDAYLEEEAAAQVEQEKAEAAFYKQKADAATQRAQELEAQVGQLSQQVAQATAAQEQASAQIQATLTQSKITQDAAMQTAQTAHAAAGESAVRALQSMEDTLRAKQLAAAIRMGAIQMKDQVMGVLANDPTQALESQLQSPPPPSSGGAPGMPGAAPAEGAGGGEEGGDPEGPPAKAKKDDAGGEDAPKKKDDDKGDAKDPSTSVTVKHGGALGMGVGGLGGAMVGAMGAARLGRPEMRDRLRSRVQELEAQKASRPESGFREALQLAAARASAESAEIAANHPVASTALGALSGLAAGSEAGDAGEDLLRKGIGNLRHAFRVSQV